MENNKQLSIPSFDEFGGCVNDRGQLGKARQLIARKFGLKPEDIKGKKLKEVKDMLIASGVTKDELKAANKEFDAHRQNYYRQVNQMNAVLAADPRFRKSIKIWKTKTGKISANVAYRETPNLAQSAQQRADNLQRENAALVARITALEGRTLTA